MKLRIQFTNGKDTINLFWLNFIENDLYCGPSDQIISMRKISYHESGQFHIKEDNKTTFKEQTIPLNEFKEFRQLFGMALYNNPIYFEKIKSANAKTPKDTVLLIDNRTLQPNTQFFFTIGILEPNRLDLIGNRIWPPIEELSKQVKQFILSTDTNPWVWIMLYVYD